MEIVWIPWFVWFIAWIFLFIINIALYLSGILEIVIEVCLNIVGSIAAFVTLQELAMHVQWKKSKNFMRFSKCSIPMYLFHQQIIYITIFCLNGIVNPYINAAINYVVSTDVSVLISVVLLRYKWTRRLIGKK